jgi:broad specificity phosphatase PhoE
MLTMQVRTLGPLMNLINFVFVDLLTSIEILLKFCYLKIDTDLTDLGENQAQTARERHALSDIELIVSSPLSRALRTADLVHPPSESSEPTKKRRIAIEHFREINGKLLNAQRRPRSDLVQKFPHWCFQEIPEMDDSWTEELESHEDCSERGYRGLLWVLQQPEQNVLLVGHGGLLNYTMNGHANIVLVDGRRQSNKDCESDEVRCVTKRFGNCELREFVITAWDSAGYHYVNNGANQLDPVITLEEVTLSPNLSL